ncbi:Fc.00g054680.m01.CDS01 [Cosmosporella sp. VM-42]
MKITIAPASTKTGEAVVRALLPMAPMTDPPVHINGLYRSLSKAPPEFTSRPDFTAFLSDLSKPVHAGFAGAEAVLAITPPAFDGRDVAAHAELVSKNVRDAIEEHGSVKRLVLLSSMGAEYDHGVGEIKTNHIAETIFAATKVPEIIVVRCAYFMENWTMSLETLKAPEPFFYSTITPLDWTVEMVAVKDIGATLATELTKPFAPSSKPHIIELHGPQIYTPLDVKAAFTEALGKEVAVKPVEHDDLPAFFSKIFPHEIVNDWVEMAKSFLPGGIINQTPPTSADVVDVIKGKTELVEVIREATARLREQGDCSSWSNVGIGHYGGIWD